MAVCCNTGSSDARIFAMANKITSCSDKQGGSANSTASTWVTPAGLLHFETAELAGHRQRPSGHMGTADRQAAPQFQVQRLYGIAMLC